MWSKHGFTNGNNAAGSPAFHSSRHEAYANLDGAIAYNLKSLHPTHALPGYPPSSSLIFRCDLLNKIVPGSIRVEPGQGVPTPGLAHKSAKNSFGSIKTILLDYQVSPYSIKYIHKMRCGASQGRIKIRHGCQ